MKFEKGSDKIFLLSDTFDMGAAFTSADIVSVTHGHAAANREQHLIYDRSTGELWYDGDGSGSHGATRFAILDNHSSHLSLSFGDFLMIG